MNGRLQAYDISEMAHLKLALDFFFPYYVDFLRVHMRAHSIFSCSSSHTCDRLNSLMTNLQIAPQITPWSRCNLLRFLFLSTLKLAYGSSIVYGQNVQV
jgi:hypothetical protein